jgi:GT2 family glycosyltransferase
MITICVPTLNNFSGLNSMIESIEQGDIVPDKYLVVDNSSGKYVKNNSKVDVYVPEKNIGVAASWNYCIKNTTEMRFILNDDLLFYKDTLSKMIDFIKADSTGIMWCPIHNAGNAFSCFAISDKCIEEIGYFDENFYPAYYEDCDYARRLLLKGREITSITDCAYIHKGSQTLARFTDEEMDDHYKTFVANRDYYALKWGGLPLEETNLFPES